jgi:DNA-binding GntR family transcriptional regulator
LTDAVVAQTRELILSGRLEAGARLTQRELAASLGVSRIPIRDALKRLEVEGLVTLSGSGAVVAPLSIADLEELFELRSVLEPMACRLAVPNIGTAEILLMQQNMDQMRVAEDSSAWHQAHGEFHSLLYRCCRRGRLVEMVDILRHQSLRYLQLHMAEPAAASEVDAEHERLLQAVRDRDGDEVERIVADHLADAHRRLVQKVLAAKLLDPSSTANRPGGSVASNRR